MRDDRRRFMRTIAATGLMTGPLLTAMPAVQKMHAPPVVGGARDGWQVLSLKTGIKIKSIESFTLGTSVNRVFILFTPCLTMVALRYG